MLGLPSRDARRQLRARRNPAATTDKRREPDDAPIDFYEPEEVLALARAASEGRHRDPRRPAVTAEEVAERARADEQDAALFVVAAFSGLRLGELLALRWRNVHFADAKLIVEASWTAGQLTSPKSRKWRAVPLADQPAAALAGLAERERFTGPRDLVFCSAVGDYLDPSALRRRYRRAQLAAGLRPLRFHDLRHSFGSLVIREFDPVAVKDFMGHSKITTTRALPPRALPANRRCADDEGLRGRRNRDGGPRMTYRRMTPYGGA
ncbi:MAG TPA: tyrosine-type recombinase/integrase [Solirubrobacteraceae bacterium]|nr:tyrosine-type recombinase/integrase [Solirubrobacteraceae bacterium]